MGCKDFGLDGSIWFSGFACGRSLRCSTMLITKQPSSASSHSPLPIFYGGKFRVYDTIPPEKVRVCFIFVENFFSPEKLLLIFSRAFCYGFRRCLIYGSRFRAWCLWQPSLIRSRSCHSWWLALAGQRRRRSGRCALGLYHFKAQLLENVSILPTLSPSCKQVVYTSFLSFFSHAIGEKNQAKSLFEFDRKLWYLDITNCKTK